MNRVAIPPKKENFTKNFLNKSTYDKPSENINLNRNIPVKLQNLKKFVVPNKNFFKFLKEFRNSEKIS